MTQLVVTELQVCPVLDVAVNRVIAEPPLLAGAVHETLADVSSTPTAVTAVGASGVTIATITAGSTEIDT
jgi:hypothetical protein